ncbi:MAG: di-trans,poly-cis-decaprenylcistransferase [Dehalococcoidia bacterium]|nr:MAG: di-trans,poly-cis-decaprenylcistransferase [Dehalococcoidia bacterium]
MPRHVAIIMDGNRRWAERRGLPRHEGHRAGVANLRRVVRQMGELGIPYVTIYGFSTENWKRDKNELAGLFRLLEEVIERETAELHQNGVKIRHLGRLEGLSPKLQEAVKNAIQLTSRNTGVTLSVAFNYGSRSEILNAIQKIIADGVAPEQIDEARFERYLYTCGLPDVDLVIRTGGEFRTSNFLMWQSAYSELYFTSVLWPDFNDEELSRALGTFARRERRFGGR